MKKYLIITTALTTICFAPEIMAQCTENTDCASLGYTETSCPDGGLKCPLGNYWYCKKTNASCDIGYILYSDKTCSKEKISEKIPIAVVIYIDESGHGQAMALNSAGSMEWGIAEKDILDLPNYTSGQTTYVDTDSCKNTEIITQAGNTNDYPAAWAAKNYSTTGTSAGDWCLPAMGILQNISNIGLPNTLSKINNGFNNAGGQELSGGVEIWASTEASSTWAWISSFDPSRVVYTVNGKERTCEVRPVIEF